MAKRRKHRKKVRSRTVLQLAGWWLDEGVLEVLRNGKRVGKELKLSANLWVLMGLLMKKRISSAGLHNQNSKLSAKVLAKELKMWGVGDGTANGVHSLVARLRKRLAGWAKQPVPAAFGKQLIVTGGGYWIDYPPEDLSLLEIPPSSLPSPSLAVRPPSEALRSIGSGPSGPVTPA